MTDTTYIFSALPEGYRIYTKARKTGHIVSWYLKYQVNSETNVSLGGQVPLWTPKGKV